MATNYIQEGKSLNYTPSGASVASGDFILLGAIGAIAKTDIADGKVGAVHVTGVFSVYTTKWKMDSHRHRRPIRGGCLHFTPFATSQNSGLQQQLARNCPHGIRESGASSTWTYLRCWNPENPEKRMWVREDKIMQEIEEVFFSLGIKDEIILNEVIAHIKKTNKIKKASHNQEVGALKKEHTELQSKLDRLLDLRIDGELTKDEFEGHKLRLKDRQYEIAQLLTTYDKEDDSFTKSLTNLLTLASEADSLWKGSTIAQKRELLNFVFANLELNGSTLCYTLRKPFDSFINMNNRPEWRCKSPTYRTSLPFSNYYPIRLLISTKKFVVVLVCLHAGSNAKMGLLSKTKNNYNYIEFSNFICIF